MPDADLVARMAADYAARARPRRGRPFADGSLAARLVDLCRFCRMPQVIPADGPLVLSADARDDATPDAIIRQMTRDYAWAASFRDIIDEVA